MGNQHGEAKISSQFTTFSSPKAVQHIPVNLIKRIRFLWNPNARNYEPEKLRIRTLFAE